MIKRFNQFIFEASYDSFARLVARELFQVIKSTTGTKVGKVITKKMEFDEPIQFELTLIVKRVVQFSPARSKHFSRLPWEIINFEELGFAMDANAYLPSEDEDEVPELELVVYISPDAESLSYDKLNYKLIEYVRHELEHFLQKGINASDGHYAKTSDSARRKAESSYKYFLLDEEIPAMVAGMYTTAVKRRMPLDQVFSNYLTPFIKSGMMNQREYSIVMNAWIDFAKQKYPAAVFSNNSH